MNVIDKWMILPNIMMVAPLISTWISFSVDVYATQSTRPVDSGLTLVRVKVLVTVTAVSEVET